MYKERGIRHFDLVASTALAMAIHAGVFLSGGIFYSEPRVFLKKGKSSIKMTIITSMSSKAIEVDSQTEVVKTVDDLEKKEEVKIHKVRTKEIKKEELKDKEPSLSKVEKNDQELLNAKEMVGSLEEKGVIIDRQLEVANLYKPEYPEYCRRHNQEGTIIISVRILANSMIDSIKVVKSSGYFRLDNAAIEALKKAKFIPAKRAGIPVASTKGIAFKFQLDEVK